MKLHVLFDKFDRFGSNRDEPPKVHGVLSKPEDAALFLEVEPRACVVEVELDALASHVMRMRLPLQPYEVTKWTETRAGGRETSWSVRLDRSARGYASIDSDVQRRSETLSCHVLATSPLTAMTLGLDRIESEVPA